MNEHILHILVDKGPKTCSELHVGELMIEKTRLMVSIVLFIMIESRGMPFCSCNRPGLNLVYLTTSGFKLLRVSFILIKFLSVGTIMLGINKYSISVIKIK